MQVRPLLALIERRSRKSSVQLTQSVPSLERSRSDPDRYSRRRDQMSPHDWSSAGSVGHGDRGRRGDEEPFVAAVTAGRLDTLALFEAAVSRMSIASMTSRRSRGTTATC